MTERKYLAVQQRVAHTVLLFCSEKTDDPSFLLFCFIRVPMPSIHYSRTFHIRKMYAFDHRVVILPFLSTVSAMYMGFVIRHGLLSPPRLAVGTRYSLSVPMTSRSTVRQYHRSALS